MLFGISPCDRSFVTVSALFATGQVAQIADDGDDPHRRQESVGGKNMDWLER